MRGGVRLLLRWTRRLSAVAGAVLLLLCFGAAAEESLGVTVVDESSQDPPVIITSATARVADNGARVPDYWFLTTVGLQESSYKPIEALRIQWDLYDATELYLGTYIEDLRQESPDIPLLMAGDVRYVVWNRNHTHLSTARVAVALTFVLFQDGTRWQLRQSGKAASLRQH
jgi:hypothetical protein